MPGTETSRFGGNSSCLEVRAEGAPPLVLDCGTGARALGRDVVLRHEHDVHVLFTHFHMDHLFGFPFFGPLYAPNCQVHVGVPAYSGVDGQTKMGRYLNGIYHPVRIQDLAARVSFSGVRPGRDFDMGPYRVRGVALNHPGGSLGYRISLGERTLVYLTDTAPMARPGEGLVDGRLPPPPERRVLDTMAGADIVVMDTMFQWEEYLEKMTWGHAYPEYAVRMAEEAGVRRLVLFHHAPDATDDELDALAARWAEHRDPVVVLAREGEALDLEG